MKITEILKPSAILLKQEITSKEQVLDTMLNCLEKTGLLAKPDEARKAVLENNVNRDWQRFCTSSWKN